MSIDIAKAGWLFRQSSFLHRWKRNWFVLYQDGHLKYFESPDRPIAEEAIPIRGACYQVQAGIEVADVTPPEGGYSTDCLLKLNFSDKSLVLCAESPDDMRAWQISFEQARVAPIVPPRGIQHPPPYSVSVNGYPTQNVTYVYPNQSSYYGRHPPAYVVQGGQPGNTTVVIRDDPYYYGRGYNGGDLALGMVGGAALGSLMWGPLLWW